MSENKNEICSFNNVPNEILFQILSYLPVKEMIKCRQVHERWRMIVDDLTDDEELWFNACLKDFNEIYCGAKKKGTHTLSWFNLYKSLCLWSKLTDAAEEIRVFACKHEDNQRITNVRVVGDGTVGVTLNNIIEYFNIQTLKQCGRNISIKNVRVDKNEYLTVIQRPHLIYIINNRAPHALFERTGLDYRINFVLIENTLIYVDKELYACDFSNDEIKCTFISRIPDCGDILMLTYKNDCIRILTSKQNIFKLVNNDLILERYLKNEQNILNVLYEFKFLEQMDWLVYSDWVSDRNIPEGPAKNINVMQMYGDTFFVGSVEGILSIFYRPFINGELDLYGSTPIRQVNFVEPSGIPLRLCPIISIDVQEIDDGHLIFVAMQDMVAMLKYTHG